MPSWGSLVARALTLSLSPVAASCGASAPAPAAPPSSSTGVSSAARPEAATSAASSTAAAPQAPVVGPLAPLGGPTSSGRSGPFLTLRARTPSFVVQVTRFSRRSDAPFSRWAGAPFCLLDNPACSVVEVARWPEPVSPTAWLGAVEPPGLGAPSAPVAGAHPWFDLSGGREVVYAAREVAGGIAIDRIDAEGRSTPWLEDTTSGRWVSARVVETAGGRVVVGEAPGQERGHLQVARVVEQGARASLDTPNTLALSPVDDQRQSAQGARVAEGEGDDALWKPWFAVADLDDAGQPAATWSLVAVVVRAPPYHAPVGRPFRHPPRRARHGCSGPGSRSLFDASVSKRFVRLRFEGARKVSEVSFDAPPDYLHDRLLRVDPQPGGALAIDARVVSATGSVSVRQGVRKLPKPAAPQDSFTLRDVDVVAAAFDAPSGEGLVVFRSNDAEEVSVARFDAEGNAVRGVATSSARGGDHLARVDGEWLAWSHDSVVWLTGERAGARIDLDDKHGRAIDLLPRRTGRADMFIGGYFICALAELDLVAMKVTSIVYPPLCEAKKRPISGRFVLPDGREVVAVDHEQRRFCTLDDVCEPAPDADVNTGDLVAQPVFKGAGGVRWVTRYGATATSVTWLGRGGPVRFANPKGWFGRPREDAPWYLDGSDGTVWGTHLLGPEPGDPLSLPEAPLAVRDGCRTYVPTGPRRGVLVCTEATSATEPGVTLGLRAVRF